VKGRPRKIRLEKKSARPNLPILPVELKVVNSKDWACMAKEKREEKDVEGKK